MVSLSATFACRKISELCCLQHRPPVLSIALHQNPQRDDDNNYFSPFKFNRVNSVDAVMTVGNQKKGFPADNIQCPVLGIHRLLFCNPPAINAGTRSLNSTNRHPQPQGRCHGNRFQPQSLQKSCGVCKAVNGDRIGVESVACGGAGFSSGVGLDWSH